MVNQYYKKRRTHNWSFKKRRGYVKKDGCCWWMKGLKIKGWQSMRKRGKQCETFIGNKKNNKADKRGGGGSKSYD